VVIGRETPSTRTGAPVLALTPSITTLPHSPTPTSTSLPFAFTSERKSVLYPHVSFDRSLLYRLTLSPRGGFRRFLCRQLYRPSIYVRRSWMSRITIATNNLQEFERSMGLRMCWPSSPGGSRSQANTDKRSCGADVRRGCGSTCLIFREDGLVASSDITSWAESSVDTRGYTEVGE
jgi:hypothetical protein